MTTAALPPQISAISHAGLEAWRLRTRHGQAIVARHGGQLLSWVPQGQRDVLWLSPRLKPLPAALRGGVPVCWPWFAKQGMPAGGQQHGPVRNLPWDISRVHQADDEVVCISLAPQAGSPAPWPGDLQLTQTLTLGQHLTQTLRTHNTGSAPFALTQALHSYFAVGDARQVAIEGLQALGYHDKLLGDSQHVQQQPFTLDTACDRVYDGAKGHYVLQDAHWQRRIAISASGSRAVVVWNPGAEQAANMADVGAQAWTDFFCVEVANAGDDVVMLAPGATHELAQTLTVEPLGH
jgi:glucose-6-phosphate 1-epimerase